ncbi:MULTISPECIES: hypothetical protein [Streptomyces]|uniref:Phytase-like domain-containing protein n=1 Tax=Streptomyces glycanivorans TaxID=3033808 RepID=A0ABY9JLZ8_9ACTN|nr:MULTISPECIES: hypothetical protein [unclassified Streptomyces]WLQ68750.1 hypothetical protein P8A20_36755 [Streptomyces sp. Alt3]WSQ89436.1 hypothetical protein OG722_36160 [Streptomyces sp. NBC_01212]WSR46171.1 hypothetical protein OG279_00460 [Streptomyces sp. NBC_01201]
MPSPIAALQPVGGTPRGPDSGGPLLDENNIAVLTDNTDASAVHVYTERTDPSAPIRHCRLGHRSPIA